MSLVREIFTMRPGESRRRRLPTLARRALLTGAAVLVASVCSVNAGQAAFTASASQHVVKQAGCTPGLCRPGVLAAGAYTVSNFIPGMTVSVPGGGWSSSEDSTGEFNLHPPGHALDATIFFWLDPHPVTYNDGPVAGVAGTPAGILHWLRHNRNVVLSRQTRRVVAEIGRAHV